MRSGNLLTINLMGFVRQIRKATGPSPRRNPTLQNVTQFAKISRHSRLGEPTRPEPAAKQPNRRVMESKIHANSLFSRHNWFRLSSSIRRPNHAGTCTNVHNNAQKSPIIRNYEGNPIACAARFTSSQSSAAGAQRSILPERVPPVPRPEARPTVANGSADPSALRAQHALDVLAHIVRRAHRLWNPGPQFLVQARLAQIRMVREPQVLQPHVTAFQGHGLYMHSLILQTVHICEACWEARQAVNCDKYA
jgi:hypothetical protein